MSTGESFIISTHCLGKSYKDVDALKSLDFDVL